MAGTPSPDRGWAALFGRLSVRSVAVLSKTSDWLSGLNTSSPCHSTMFGTLPEAMPPVEMLTSDVACAARSRTYT